MQQIVSGDATIAYEVRGSGPAVELLHPFPASHEFWHPVAAGLEDRYRLILPDLRGHGASSHGEGPATMAKLAGDVARVCDAAGVEQAAFVGVSIGGYLLFEFWRRYRERVRGLVLCNTKASADDAAAQANRLRIADEVEQRGTGEFLDDMIPKMLGKTTQRNRPDVVAAARAMMQRMTPPALAAVQRGMASRADSMPLLKTIDVPTLIMTGDEDALTGVADALMMRGQIRGSELKVIERAAHYAAMEQPVAVGAELRQFLDGMRWE